MASKYHRKRPLSIHGPRLTPSGALGSRSLHLAGTLADVTLRTLIVAALVARFTLAVVGAIPGRHVPHPRADRPQSRTGAAVDFACRSRTFIGERHWILSAGASIVIVHFTYPTNSFFREQLGSWIHEQLSTGWEACLTILNTKHVYPK